MSKQIKTATIAVAPEASKASTLENFTNFSLIEDVPEVEYKTSEKKNDPLYQRILKETFLKYLKQLANKQDFDGCEFIYHKEGNVIQEPDLNDSYRVCYKLERCMDINEIFFSCHIINSAGELVFWDNIELFNTEQYIKNVGGVLYLGDGISATFLPSDFYFNNDEPFEDIW